MGIGFFNIPLLGRASALIATDCFGSGGGSIGGATVSRGEGAGRARQKARGMKVYVESIAVTEKKILDIHQNLQDNISIIFNL